MLIKFLDGSSKEFTNLSGATLSWATLSVANLSRADLSGANLSWADLSGATLSGANLSRANLSRANLSGANLSGANLSGANLRDAKLPISGLITTDLANKMYALKAVNKDGKSIMVHGGPGEPLDYSVGKRVSVNDANEDVRVLCGAGINVANKEYILNNHSNNRIMLVSFSKSDIAALPLGSDGKFRLHRCFVEREVTDELFPNKAK